MTRNETKELGCDEKLFKQVVKTTFNQRRKTLRNSIKPILVKAAAADWVLNSVISMGMSLNPDAKAVESLRTNFEQQGGRVL